MKAYNRNIENLELEELNSLIREYPWFSVARREIYLKMSSFGDEYSEEGLKKLYLIYNPRHVIKESKREVKKIITEEKIEIKPTTMPKIHIVGGDYFTNEEINNNNHVFINHRTEIKKTESKFDDTIFDDKSFYTETLADIYLHQGFYDKAIEVYSKLILLYPRKSVYFASLIEDLKKL